MRFASSQPLITNAQSWDDDRSAAAGIDVDSSVHHSFPAALLNWDTEIADAGGMTARCSLQVLFAIVVTAALMATGV